MAERVELSPGVWAQDGVMHIDAAVFLRANGYEPTESNVRQLEQAAAALGRTQGFETTRVDDDDDDGARPCPACGFSDGMNYVATRQGSGEVHGIRMGIVEFGWRCPACEHEWGFEVLEA